VSFRFPRFGATWDAAVASAGHGSTALVQMLVQDGHHLRRGPVPTNTAHHGSQYPQVAAAHLLLSGGFAAHFPGSAAPYRLDQSSVIFPDFPEFMISKPSR
jgi:hypothetical protein